MVLVRLTESILEALSCAFKYAALLHIKCTLPVLRDSTCTTAAAPLQLYKCNCTTATSPMQRPRYSLNHYIPVECLLLCRGLLLATLCKWIGQSWIGGSLVVASLGVLVSCELCNLQQRVPKLPGSQRHKLYGTLQLDSMPQTNGWPDRHVWLFGMPW